MGIKQKLIVLLENILTFFLPSLLSLIPRNKKLWIFSAWSGLKYADNPKAFYEYVRDNTEVDAVWITKSKEQVLTLRKQGVNSLYYLSFKGMLSQLFASKAFLSHNIGAEFYRPLISKSTLRVNLWHGMPFKKIRFDDQCTYSPFYIWIKSSKLYRFISNERYDYISSLGPTSTKILSSAFRLDKNKFIEVGFPRNDLLVNECEPDKEINTDFCIVYMPTFRGELGKSFNLIEQCGFDFEKVENALQKAKAKLILKIHPANKLTTEDLAKVSISKRIFFSENEPYKLLDACDALITDYSSVMFDFVLTKKKLVFFPYDHDIYFSKERKAYFDYKKITNNCSAKTMQDCITMLTVDYQSIPFNEYLLKIHKFENGSASERLYHFLKTTK